MRSVLTPVRDTRPRWIRWTLIGLGIAALAVAATIAEGILMWYLIFHYLAFKTP